MTDWATVSVSPETVVVDIPDIGLQGPPGPVGPAGPAGPNAGSAAGGDLGATYPNPTVVATHLSAPLPVAQGGTAAITVAAARTSLGAAPIAGVTDGSSAAAGQVGELLSATASTVSQTSLTPVNVTTLSLTAGDWDVSAELHSAPAGTTVQAFVAVGLSTVSATMPGTLGQFAYSGCQTFAGVAMSAVVGPTRFSLTVTTTVYLVSYCNFSTSTLTVSGIIRARRVR